MMFVFIVGLPRSGTTLLSKYINSSGDNSSVVSLSDFYLLPFLVSNFSQYRKNPDEFNSSLREFLTFFFNERLNVNNRFEGQLELSGDVRENVFDKMGSIVVPSNLDLRSLVSNVYSYLRNALSASVLVDKTPQNFFYVDLLRRALPGCRFIYLIRNPFDIAVSYKFADFKGHDKRRYHPVVYAYYWNKMIASCLGDSGEDVAVIKYEDIKEGLSGSALKEIEKLGLPVSQVPAIASSNTSFSSGKKVLADWEVALIGVVTKEKRAIFEYEDLRGRLGIFSVFPFIAVTFRFIVFNFQRIVLSKDARTRVASFFRAG